MKLFRNNGLAQVAWLLEEEESILIRYS